MRLFLLVVALASPIAAGATNSWDYTYVVRGERLETKTGPATLHRDGERLAGKLASVGGDISVFVELSGKTAIASLRSSSDINSELKLTGTFQQLAQADGACWQTIQVQDGSNSLTLARSQAQCEP